MARAIPTHVQHSTILSHKKIVFLFQIKSARLPRIDVVADDALDFDQIDFSIIQESLQAKLLIEKTLSGDFLTLDGSIRCAHSMKSTAHSVSLLISWRG